MWVCPEIPNHLETIKGIGLIGLGSLQIFKKTPAPRKEALGRLGLIKSPKSPMVETIPTSWSSRNSHFTQPSGHDPGHPLFGIAANVQHLHQRGFRWDRKGFDLPQSCQGTSEKSDLLGGCLCFEWRLSIYLYLCRWIFSNKDRDCTTVIWCQTELRFSRKQHNANFIWVSQRRVPLKTHWSMMVFPIKTTICAFPIGQTHMSRNLRPFSTIRAPDQRHHQRLERLSCRGPVQQRFSEERRIRWMEALMVNHL